MIYTADDYIEKYIDTLGYIISRAYLEKYSPLYIESIISHSHMIEELEKSNVTTIAFSSSEKIYHDLFPQFENDDYKYNPYDAFGWLAYIYIHLFLKYQITFELLFIILPIEKGLSIYKLYHEMDIRQTYDLFEELVSYSYLDVIMKKKKMSVKELSLESGVSSSTINSLRYGKRDISKLESAKSYKLSRALNIKMTSLLRSLELKMDEEF